MKNAITTLSFILQSLLILILTISVSAALLFDFSIIRTNLVGYAALPAWYWWHTAALFLPEHITHPPVLFVIVLVLSAMLLVILIYHYLILAKNRSYKNARKGNAFALGLLLCPIIVCLLYAQILPNKQFEPDGQLQSEIEVD